MSLLDTSPKKAYSSFPSAAFIEKLRDIDNTYGEAKKCSSVTWINLAKRLFWSSSSLVCIAQIKSVFVKALKGVYLVAINEARGSSPLLTDVRTLGYSTLYTVSSKFWSPSKLPTTTPLALCNRPSSLYMTFVVMSYFRGDDEALLAAALTGFT